jgi:hypothetical protein
MKRFMAVPFFYHVVNSAHLEPKEHHLYQKLVRTSDYKYKLLFEPIKA